MDNREYMIQYKQDNTWRMHQLHYHEGIELMLVLSDGGDFYMDRKTYPLRKNTLFIMNENRLHRDEAGESGSLFRRYVFHVLPSLLKQLSTPRTDFLQLLSGIDGCIRLSGEDTQRLSRMFEKLRISMPNTFGADILEKITLYEILLFISNRIRQGTIQSGIQSPDAERIQPILDYLRKNYAEKISLDALAREFSLSKHYLCHVFKTGTGVPIMEYVIRLRINASQHMLRLGASVQDASEKCGFQSYSHFIRTFHDIVGQSPKKYAKAYQDSVSGDKNRALLPEPRPLRLSPSYQHPPLELPGRRR